MQPSSDIAFKEWASVCAALAAGRQTIILRKGGIAEGRHGFRVEHPEFWLLPTNFHQDAGALVADAEPFWRAALAEQPPAGTFRVNLYAVVHEVFGVVDLDKLANLAGEHVLSAAMVEQRFHYRHPGLFVLVVRVYRLSAPFEVADSEYIAGCKSWIELPERHATAGALPVLDDAQFAERSRTIHALLADD